MKIRLTCAIYNEKLGAIAFGDVVEIEDKIAKSLIENNMAELVEEEKSKPITRKKTKKEVEE